MVPIPVLLPLSCVLTGLSSLVTKVQPGEPFFSHSETARSFIPSSKVFAGAVPSAGILFPTWAQSGLPLSTQVPSCLTSGSEGFSGLILFVLTLCLYIHLYCFLYTINRNYTYIFIHRFIYSTSPSGNKSHEPKDFAILLTALSPVPTRCLVYNQLLRQT